MKKSKNRHRNYHKYLDDLQAIFWLVIGFGSVIWLSMSIYHSVAKNSALDKGNNETIKAVIIDERNYLPNHNLHHDFSYSYTFTLAEKVYKGDSYDIKLHVGDSIDVEYVKGHPELSRPACHY